MLHVVQAYLKCCCCLIEAYNRVVEMKVFKSSLYSATNKLNLHVIYLYFMYPGLSMYMYKESWVNCTIHTQLKHASL